MVAQHLMSPAMIGQARIAKRAIRHPATLATEPGRGIAAPVQEQQYLIIAIEMLANAMQQSLGHAMLLLLLAHVDGFQAGPLLALCPLL
jgi:hypothetical protein